MLRFRLSGIPFAVTPYFWVGSAIFGAGAAHGPNGLLLLAVWVLCVFVSIVLHELGHALAARQVGVSPYVVLYQMGGLTYLPGGAMSRAASNLRQLGGPAAGIFGYVCVLARRYCPGHDRRGGLGGVRPDDQPARRRSHRGPRSASTASGRSSTCCRFCRSTADRCCATCSAPGCWDVTRSHRRGLRGGVCLPDVHAAAPAVHRVFPRLPGFRQFPG